MLGSQGSLKVGSHWENQALSNITATVSLHLLVQLPAAHSVRHHLPVFGTGAPMSHPHHCCEFLSFLLVPVHHMASLGDMAIMECSKAMRGSEAPLEDPTG